jgi:hypothetical protein
MQTRTLQRMWTAVPTQGFNAQVLRAGLREALMIARTTVVVIALAANVFAELVVILALARAIRPRWPLHRHKDRRWWR